MSAPKEPPRAGYRLNEVYALEQHYRVVPPDELPEASSGEEEQDREFRISWDWQVAGEGLFAVFLGLSSDATPAAPEEIRVAMLGEFAIVGENQSLAFQPFVKTSAPAILFPYLREAVRSLTGRGPMGGWTVPPVNVVALAESHDFDQATGTRELR